MLAAVILVLLIACVNVRTCNSARGVARQRTGGFARAGATRLEAGAANLTEVSCRGTRNSRESPRLLGGRYVHAAVTSGIVESIALLGSNSRSYARDSRIQGPELLSQRLLRPFTGIDQCSTAMARR